MNVGDVVWWTRCAGAWMKVRLTEDLGERFVYRTVGGRTGFKSDDVKANFKPIPRKKDKS